MEYVYGAMLLHSAGQEINEANIEKVMIASGVKPEPARIKALIASLDGVDIDDAISTAAQVAAPAAPAGAPAAPAPSEAPKEEAKPKKEEKKTEEEAAAGLAGLFG